MTPPGPSTDSSPKLFKAPVQARSEATLQRILAAAIELFDAKEYTRVSMSEIAARADVSVATLYTRFRDKEALLDYLFSDLQSTRLDEVRALFQNEAWSGISIVDRVDILISQLVAGMVAHTGLFRAFSQRQLKNERTPSEIACEKEVASTLAAWLQDGVREDGRNLPVRAARMAVSLIGSSVRLQIIFGITCGLSREEFIDQLSTAVHAFIDAAAEQNGATSG